MAQNSLIEKSGIQIKLGSYGVASATALRDPSILPKVQDYRRQTGSRMYPLDRNDILRKIPTADFHVSRKLDGEFTALFFDSENLFSINPGGTVRIGLPWQQEAEELLGSPMTTGTPTTQTQGQSMIVTTPVSGPKGQGTFVFKGTMVGTTWERDEIYLEVDGERIDLDPDSIFNVEVSDGL